MTIKRFRANKAGLSGERGLLVAIVATAAIDMQSGSPSIQASAEKYLEGPLYRHHLTLLGLPADWMPQDLD